MVQPSTADRRTGNSRISLRLRILLGIVIVLGLLIGLNAFVLDHETGKAKLNVAGARLIDTTSGPIQVLDTGPDRPSDSLPLVLIHGSAGAINWWDEVIPTLRKKRRVVAVDLLGYGGSTKPDSDYSVEAQAGLVAQVLSRLKISRAVAVGHSLGGSVATALARNSPGLVAGVVLIDSTPDRSIGGLGLTARAAMAPVVGPLLWRFSPDSVRRRGLSQAFAPGTPVPPKYVTDLKQMTYPAYRDSGRANKRYLGEASLPSRLEAAGLPLLVLFGAEDRIYPARESLSAYAGIPGVKTVLIPGSGHSPQVEAPGRTAAGILAFAAGIDHAEKRRAARRARLSRARIARESAARIRRARLHAKNDRKHHRTGKRQHRRTENPKSGKSSAGQP